MLIVDNVIGVSNLKTTMSESFSTQIKLGDLLDEVFAFIESETKMRNLDVVVDNKFKTDKTIMVSDAFRVKKTLYQLVLNSVKFTEKGHIKFGCDRNGKMLEFFVHDTGIGISESDKQEVFKLFRKGSFKKEKLYGGSGLGLSIAKASVEGMGGSISLESELDVGTKVKFWVPFDFEKN
jgi:signal transduction histidine kinase